MFTYEKFMGRVLHCIKMSIYVNKGIKDYNILKGMIDAYNYYAKIDMETTNKTSLLDDNKIAVDLRKCIKRFNMSLKIDNDCPLDYHNKENQRKIFLFEEHNSIKNNSINDMISYATENEIQILPNIYITDLLKSCEYQILIWQYLRSIYYISQILIIETCTKSELTDKIFNDALLLLEKVLEEINEELDTKIATEMKDDSFLKSKLSKTIIGKNKIDSAKSEIKEFFNTSGINLSTGLNDIVEKVSNKLIDKNLDDMSENTQSFFSIAKDIASDINNKEDVANEINIKQMINGTSKILGDIADDSSNITEAVKGITETIEHINKDEEVNIDETLAKFNNILGENKLTDDLLSKIKNVKNSNDISKIF